MLKPRSSLRKSNSFAPIFMRLASLIAGDLMVFKGVVIDLIINVAIAIFIVSFMYCRIERIAWNYSVERREYMANLEAYANEKLQLEKGLLGAGSVNMLSLPLIPSN
ncbi:hypothetical protein TL16_g12411 [Triparma laevis f. inornata]|uniref:Uncharacterized protein n=1 Tax=Triparma laevis f. inornata TaxID=1714386 RepID=A0A9W7EWQ7_9STRA|nr:hypothetical protein TL16_g12411 [Triparma laevis f. inornata]